MSAFNVVDHATLRIITISGDIDATNADDLELACLDADVKRTVIIDLLTCSYIDSTGLTALIKASHHNPLTLVLEPTARVYRIFAITELLNYFTVAATIDEALARSSGDEGMTAPARELESVHTLA